MATIVTGVALLYAVDPRVARLWLNTSLLAAGACAIALPLGTLAAVLIVKTDVPGRSFAGWVLVGMLFMPLYLITGAWDAGFGIQGWHTLTTNPHLAHGPWLAGWRAAVWVHGLGAIPWVVLIVGAALKSVEPEVEEDAASCTTPLRVLWYISLPRALPAIGIAAVWIFTIVLTEISVTDFFQVRTFAEEVYTQAALGTFNAVAKITEPTEPLPAAGLWLGLLLAAIVALVVIAAVSKLFANLSDIQSRPPWIWRLKSLRVPSAFILLLLLTLCVGVPVGNLLYKAGVHVTMTGAGRVRSWSLLKATEAIVNAPYDFRQNQARSDFSGELWLSVRLGFAAATAAVAIALPLAWSLRRRAPLLRWAILLGIALCLTIPGPLLGLAVIRILNRPPDSPFAFLATLYDSNFAPWLVQTIRAAPIATLVLWPAFASIPQATLDAASIDGVGFWHRLAQIAIPQRWTSIVAAWLIALAVAVGELAATILVMPPQSGATALSIQIFSLLHYGVDDRVAAICLVMLAAIAAITGIAGTLLKRRSIGQ